MSILWFLVNSLAFGMDQGVDKGYATIGLALGGHEGLLTGDDSSSRGLILERAPAPGAVFRWGAPSPQPQSEASAEGALVGIALLLA